MLVSYKHSSLSFPKQKKNYTIFPSRLKFDGQFFFSDFISWPLFILVLPFLSSGVNVSRKIWGKIKNTLFETKFLRISVSYREGDHFVFRRVLCRYIVISSHIIVVKSFLNTHQLECANYCTFNQSRFIDRK